MKHVVFFSGGLASFSTALRVADRAEAEDELILLFTDTLMEDEDLYRFLDEAAEVVIARTLAAAKFVRLEDGRTPWEVFFDKRFLGNTRVDPCSRILKRELAASWVEENCDPEVDVLYLGLTWEELHRVGPVVRNWEPYRVECPLTDPPYIVKSEMHAEAIEHGVEPPRLYALGFPHNNCGGFCIKAGQAHFKLLLDTMPERYAFHEAEEQRLREHLGRDDIAILRDRTGGETRPITLREFRERVEAEGEGQCDLFDWGGCGCFVDVE